MKPRPLSPALLTCLVLCAALLSGCFGGNNFERTYYALQYPMGEQVQEYTSPRYPITIRIHRFDSTLSYNRQEMVYRTNPHEFRYYAYKLWSARPAKMLQELFANHLRQSNLATSVIIDVMDHIPEYEISAEVIAIEELDASASEWFAHLSMRMSMMRSSDNHIVWQYTFDERKAVFNQQPVFIVRAMSEIMEAQMLIVVKQIDEVLAKELNVAPPERPSHAIPTSTTHHDGADHSGDKGGADPGEETPPAAPQPKATLKERR
jgi:ABC-type uncharacterized transport system auxiliary subunit